MPSDYECEMRSRVEALEKTNEQHGNTHREIFSRLNNAEINNAVQNEQYNSIIKKLDKLDSKLELLEAKPGKRWDSLVEKAVWAVCAAVIAFLLGRVGL